MTSIVTVTLMVTVQQMRRPFGTKVDQEVATWNTNQQDSSGLSIMASILPITITVCDTIMMAHRSKKQQATVDNGASPKMTMASHGMSGREQNSDLTDSKPLSVTVTLSTPKNTLQATEKYFHSLDSQMSKEASDASAQTRIT